jgi:hypothetical protein
MCFVLDGFTIDPIFKSHFFEQGSNKPPSKLKDTSTRYNRIQSNGRVNLLWIVGSKTAKCFFEFRSCTCNFLKFPKKTSFNSPKHHGVSFKPAERLSNLPGMPISWDFWDGLKATTRWIQNPQNQPFRLIDHPLISYFISKYLYYLYIPRWCSYYHHRFRSTYPLVI